VAATPKAARPLGSAPPLLPCLAQAVCCPDGVPETLEINYMAFFAYNGAYPLFGFPCCLAGAHQGGEGKGKGKGKRKGLVLGLVGSGLSMRRKRPSLCPEAWRSSPACRHVACASEGMRGCHASHRH